MRAVVVVTGVGVVVDEERARRLVNPRVLALLDSQGIDPLGVSLDALLVFTPHPGEVIARLRQAGVRAGICMMPVPAWIFVVRARIHATGVTASVEYASPVQTWLKPSRSASTTTGARWSYGSPNVCRQTPTPTLP